MVAVTTTAKPRLAVHKFSSCDGCQLALLNLGEDLLVLTELVDIRHFAEAGILGEDEEVDVALVEGSISTAEDMDRIQRIRERTRKLLSIGACATAGGPQALRNKADAKAWTAAVYPVPEYVAGLDHVQPVSAVVPVDFELWGCPVSGRQVVAAMRALLSGVAPVDHADKVCLECKRQQRVCVMVTEGRPCMGPVTRTGCGALCPSLGRACYGCFGPAENLNTDAIGRRLRGLGLDEDAVVQRFEMNTSQARPFAEAVRRFQGQR